MVCLRLPLGVVFGIAERFEISFGCPDGFGFAVALGVDQRVVVTLFVGFGIVE